MFMYDRKYFLISRSKDVLLVKMFRYKVPTQQTKNLFVEAKHIEKHHDKYFGLSPVLILEK